MTLNELQRQLIEEIEIITKDMGLLNRKGEPAQMRGYPQAVPVFPLQLFPVLPGKGSEAEPCWDEAEGLFPYFVVRIDGAEYQKEEDVNQARVLIAFAVCDEDTKLRGYFTLTAVMERVIERFQKNPVLGPFWCERKMNAAYQEDDTYSQFFGALEMAWNVPAIEREEVYE